MWGGAEKRAGIIDGSSKEHRTGGLEMSTQKKDLLEGSVKGSIRAKLGGHKEKRGIKR